MSLARRPGEAARLRDPAAGVTLVEVLVALVLFALIGTAGFAVLDQVIRVQDLTEGRQRRLAQLQRAMHVVTQDLMHATGGSLSAADGAVAFRRTAGEGEMAVRYALEDTTLTRTVSGGPGASATRQALLAELGAVDWTFLDPEGGWTESWPPFSVGNVQRNPAAVALDLVVTGPAPSGALRRIAVLPAEPGP